MPSEVVEEKVERTNFFDRKVIKNVLKRKKIKQKLNQEIHGIETDILIPFPKRQKYRTSKRQKLADRKKRIDAAANQTAT